MTIFNKLNLMVVRFKRMAEDIEAIAKEAKEHIKNQRLDRNDVEGLLEYTDGYTYKMDIPFDDGKYISYKDLHRWVCKYKPNRKKRLERNYQAFIEEYIEQMEAV